MQVLFKMAFTDNLSNIRCFITDVDGVLSNGLLYLANDGNEYKSFHVHDGMGLKLLMHAGLEVAVITTSKNHIIDVRMKQLGIKYYYCGMINKLDAYQSLKQQLLLSDEQFAYIGDDLPDIDILKRVGFSAATRDAVIEVRESVDYVTQAKGGHGAVREVCNMILHAKDSLDEALASYLNG